MISYISVPVIGRDERVAGYCRVALEGMSGLEIMRIVRDECATSTRQCVGGVPDDDDDDSMIDDADTDAVNKQWSCVVS